MRAGVMRISLQKALPLDRILPKNRRRLDLSGTDTWLAPNPQVPVHSVPAGAGRPAQPITATVCLKATDNVKDLSV